MEINLRTSKLIYRSHLKFIFRIICLILSLFFVLYVINIGRICQQNVKFEAKDAYRMRLEAPINQNFLGAIS